jgi:WD40 repeat protein
MGHFWLPMYLNFCVMAAMPAEEHHVHHSFRYETSSGSSLAIQAMTFSPDGRQLAVSVSDHVDFIDLNQGDIIRQFKARPFSIKYTQDGRRLYMISTSEACLLDVQSGVVTPTTYRQIKSDPGINLEQRNGKLLIKSLVRGGSADVSEALQVGDELLAFSNGQNGKMERITGWSLESAKEAFKGYNGTYARLTVLPKGRYGAKNEKTLTLRRTIAAGNGQSSAASASGNRPFPQAIAWCMPGRDWHEFRDAATGQPVSHIQTVDIDNVGLYALSPDQKMFAVVANKKDRDGYAVEVFDLASQERLAFVPLSTTSFLDIAFAPDNNRVLVGTWNTVEVCDIAKEAVVSQLTFGYQLPTAEETDRQNRSPGGLMMRSVMANIADGAMISGNSSRQLVNKIAVSAKNLVAVGDRAGNIGIWNLESDSLVATLPAEHADTVEHLQFSPNGRWLAYYVGGALHIEDVSTLPAPKADAEDASQNNSEDTAVENIVTVVPSE